MPKRFQDRERAENVKSELAKPGLGWQRPPYNLRAETGGLASAVYYLNNRPHWLTHMDSDMDTNPDTNPDRNQQTATYLSRPQRTYPDRNVPIQTATNNDRTPRAKRVCDWLRDF